jgi:hypothetical protein
VGAVSCLFDGLAPEPRRHGVRRCVSWFLDAPAGRTPHWLGEPARCFGIEPVGGGADRQVDLAEAQLQGCVGPSTELVHLLPSRVELQFGARAWTPHGRAVVVEVGGALPSSIGEPALVLQP